MRKKLYKVTFLSQGKTLELYARQVTSSALWGGETERSRDAVKRIAREAERP